MNNNNEKYNIVCFSNQMWDYPLWTNKKHVMLRLHNQGHNILFVDPPINMGRLLFRQILRHQWSLKRLLTQRYKDNGLNVFTPIDPIPFHTTMAKLHTKRISHMTNKLFDKNRKTLIWFYHVEIEGAKEYIEGIKHDHLIYDCVDNYSAFPKHNTKEKKDIVMYKETYLAKKADTIFVSAPGLIDKMTKLNPNTHYTPNVGDYEKFKNIRNQRDNLPEDIKDIPKPRVGFTGAVDKYKFDAQLVRKLALDYPSYSFVIIGPFALKDKEASLQDIGLGGLPNLYFLGTKDFSIIQNYTAAFDAMIIPFQLNDYTVGGCFPVKFHEYLAGGLPVVVTDLPAYMPFKDVSYISKDYNEFSQNLRRAIEEDNLEKISQRQKVAQENTWEKKIEKMLDIIGDSLK